MAEGEPDDPTLLARFVDHGDEEAFQLIVERHGGVVYGVCKRLLRDGHLAEDAFQQTMLALARNAHRIACDGTLVRWLHTTAWRMAKDLAVRAHRRHERTLEQPIMQQISDNEDLDRLQDDARDIIDEELAALPERERSMLLLRYVEGQSRADCARALGMPLGSTSDLLKRAAGHLRHRLEGRGVAVGSLLLVGLLQQAAAEVPRTLVHRTVHQACAWHAGSAATTSATGGTGLGVKLAGLVAVGALAGLGASAAMLWWPRQAPTAPAPESAGRAIAVDPYRRSSWVVESGLPWVLTSVVVDGAQRPAIRLGPPDGEGASAQLDVAQHLPRSFRFAYRFVSADSAAGLEHQAAGAWMRRELHYRLLPDGSGYAVVELRNGERRAWRDSLDFATGDPFTVAVGRRVWLLLRDLELELGDPR